MTYWNRRTLCCYNAKKDNIYVDAINQSASPYLLFLNCLYICIFCINSNQQAHLVTKFQSGFYIQQSSQHSRWSCFFLSTRLSKDRRTKNQLANAIINVLKQKSTLIINSCGLVAFNLFTSSKTLLLPTCTKLVDDLTKKNILNLLFIDDVHLFIIFILSFRRQFLTLCNEIFNKLIQHTVPPTLNQILQYKKYLYSA